MNFTLKDLELLKSVSEYLQLHACKYSTDFNTLLEKLEIQKKKSLERSKQAVYKGRMKDKNYARSKTQLASKKKQEDFEDLK